MKKTVGILMGGYSSESAISMQSGETVYTNLNKDEFDVYKVVITPDEWFVTDNNQKWPLERDSFSFVQEGKKVIFDVVFNAIHGHPGEDGYLQAILELNKIPHSSCGFFESALTFNKSKTNALAKNVGVAIPKALFFSHPDQIDAQKICDELGLPLFIKPNRSGSSFGVSKVNLLKDFEPAIQEALKEDFQVVAEEAIIGTEVGCGVVRRGEKTEAIAITEIVSKREFFDYTAKYEGASEEITPARISAELYTEISRISEKLYDYFGLWGVVRIDFIIKQGTPYLIEINSIPGLSPASIIPQQLKYRNWPLEQFFGGLLHESIDHYRY